MPICFLYSQKLFSIILLKTLIWNPISAKKFKILRSSPLVLPFTVNFCQIGSLVLGLRVYFICMYPLLLSLDPREERDVRRWLMSCSFNDNHLQSQLLMLLSVRALSQKSFLGSMRQLVLFWTIYEMLRYYYPSVPRRKIIASMLTQQWCFGRSMDRWKGMIF